MHIIHITYIYIVHGYMDKYTDILTQMPNTQVLIFFKYTFFHTITVIKQVSMQLNTHVI